MFIKILITVVTFLIALSSKGSDNRDKNKRNTNLIILLISVLFLFQILEVWQNHLTDLESSAQTQETFSNLLSTKDRVDSSHHLIKGIMENLAEELAAADRELRMIESLNLELSRVRKSVESNMWEYQKLNDFYKSQYEIEDKKLMLNAPDVKVASAKSILSDDGNSVSYQIQLINYGNRAADSIRYQSAMIFIDSSGLLSNITMEKSNSRDHNALNLPGQRAQNFHINSPRMDLNKFCSYRIGLLIVKYSFFDQYQHKFIEPETLILKSENLTSIGSQFGRSVDKINIPALKGYLKHKRKSSNYF